MVMSPHVRESTENTHSTFPTASSLTCTWSKILSQVPSAVHNRNRSCAVFHGPYLAWMSRHGAPVRSRHKIALITCR